MKASLDLRAVISSATRRQQFQRGQRQLLISMGHPSSYLPLVEPHVPRQAIIVTEPSTVMQASIDRSSPLSVETGNVSIWCRRN